MEVETVPMTFFRRAGSRAIALASVAALLASCGLTPSTSRSRSSVGPTLDDEPIVRGRQINLTGPSSVMFGDCPNFSQVSNGRFLAVVSREFGRLSRPGALIGWDYPQQADNRLRFATVGVGGPNGFAWLDDMVFVDQRLVPESGRVVSRFRSADSRLEVTVEDVAVRDLDVLARQVRVRNIGTSTVPRVTTTLVHHFALVRSGVGDRLAWDEASNTFLQTRADSPLAVASAASRKPEGLQAGEASDRLGIDMDPVEDARDGVLRGNRQAGSATSLGVGGALQNAVGPIHPGETRETTYYLGMGMTGGAARAAVVAARARGWSDLVSADEAYWRQQLARATMPVAPERELAVYRRALIVLKQLQSESGAMLASSSQISPAYKYVWIQDSTIDGFAFLANGMTPEARGILDFFARVQKADGDWWVTYHADGRPNELWEHGTEAMGGHLLTLLGAYGDRTGDIGYLQNRWPMVRKACTWALDRITERGLMSENRDLWETFTDQSWSYTNLSWISGFREASRIAMLTDHASEAIRYAQAAGVLENALRVRAVVRGYLGKGVRLGPMTADPAIDACILGSVWPFRVLAPAESITRATLEQIEARLVQPGGGVRRWETDNWYGGQGWPELTDWLALVTWMAGDRPRAEQLHAANTDRAHTTGALQLGEVFDERTGRFTSAFPLGWPEAQYILTSRALHGPVPEDLLRSRR